MSADDVANYTVVTVLIQEVELYVANTDERRDTDSEAYITAAINSLFTICCYIECPLQKSIVVTIEIIMYEKEHININL